MTANEVIQNNYSEDKLTRSKGEIKKMNKIKLIFKILMMYVRTAIIKSGNKRLKKKLDKADENIRNFREEMYKHEQQNNSIR